MGRAFDVEWDDFTGGHFVGARSTGQPMNTWTGTGVICTADEGMLMPDGGWRSYAAYSTTGVNTTPLHSAWNLAGEVEFIYKSNLGLKMTSGGSITTYAPGAFSPANGHVCRAGSYVAIPSNAAASIRLSDSSTVTPPVTPSLGVWFWKGWGLVPSGYKLYFSNPYDMSTWSASNYITIPDQGSTIISVVPLADEILVLTGDAWYSITGVLGQTTVVRRVSKIGANSGSGAYCAAELQGGILFASGTDRAARILAGTTVRQSVVLNDDITSIVNAGDYLIAMNTEGPAWIYSEASRRWRCSPLPSHLSQGVDYGYYEGVENTSTYTPDLAITARRGLTSGLLTQTGKVYFQSKEPMEPVFTSGAFDSATATLAEYRAKDPFLVKKLLVEIDFGQPQSQQRAYVSQDGQRSLTAKVATNARANLAPRFLRDSSGNVELMASAPLTETWNSASSTLRGDRVMLEFDVNDGAATYAAAPQLTMQGVKVRRVILKAEAV